MDPSSWQHWRSSSHPPSSHSSTSPCSLTTPPSSRLHGRGLGSECLNFLRERQEVAVWSLKEGRVELFGEVGAGEVRAKS